MKAASYDAYAEDNSRLRYGDVPDPRVGPGQVLIEVRAAGVNPVDWKLMAGGLDAMIEAIFPVVPGWDVAGVVTATGPDTPEFGVGDEVFSYARMPIVRHGTFAEYVAVPAEFVARRPVALDWAQSAGLPLVGVTAWRMLNRLEVGPDDVLLVYNASGGVGGTAVQLGRERGARVIGTASPRNHDYVRGLGGEPVAYGDGQADRIRELAPNGVTAVADCVGGQLETTLAVLAPGGRHASIADPGVGEHGGMWVWARPDAAGLTELAALADQGALTVEIAKTFPLAEVGDAFDASRTGHTRGKLVLIP
ncbi:NADP-dependent oxidoreductase [Actinomadura gamaensis]|uniref:NADP-dependent oxidoreductase n=1 Tax=Actinomadura gamaensis TaxID=1763541 RepID=A0ABV9TYT9_9ACTN